MNRLFQNLIQCSERIESHNLLDRLHIAQYSEIVICTFRNRANLDHRTAIPVRTCQELMELMVLQHDAVCVG